MGLSLLQDCSSLRSRAERGLIHHWLPKILLMRDVKNQYLAPFACRTLCSQSKSSLLFSLFQLSGTQACPLGEYCSSFCSIVFEYWEISNFVFLFCWILLLIFLCLCVNYVWNLHLERTIRNSCYSGASLFAAWHPWIWLSADAEHIPQRASLCYQKLLVLIGIGFWSYPEGFLKRLEGHSHQVSNCSIVSPL